MYRSFDVLKYLEENNISYRDTGKNVTTGWINICCPFCNDSSHHCGISPTRFFSCWICNSKGSIKKLIKEIENCSWSKADNIIKRFSSEDEVNEHNQDNQNYQKERKNSAVFKWPAGISDKPMKLHIDYLHKRKFHYETISKQYQIRYGTTWGIYRYTLIAPIHLNGKCVSFYGRDITGKREKHWKSSIENSVVSPQSLIYNSDNIFKDKIIIVEGVFDVWRIGNNCGATMTTKYSIDQINFIRKINSGTLKKAFIMFDAEAQAQERASDLANQLSPFLDVEILELDIGDPADMKPSEVKLLKKDIGI